MQTYINTGGVIKVDPDGKETQVIYDKDGVTVRASAALKPGIMFTVKTVGEQQTKDIDIYFQAEPANGNIGVTDDALLAILYHRMRLKHAETGVDRWLETAKYLEEVEESLYFARDQKN